MMNEARVEGGLIFFIDPIKLVAPWGNIFLVSLSMLGVGIKVIRSEGGEVVVCVGLFEDKTF